MEYYPWWNEAQRKLADEAKKVTDEILIPLSEKAAWKKEFPWETMREIAKRGWFGAQIPAKYGGRAEEWGVTGAVILLEELGREEEAVQAYREALRLDPGFDAVAENLQAVEAELQVHRAGTRPRQKVHLPCPRPKSPLRCRPSQRPRR